MFTARRAYSGFAVDDVPAAHAFYAGVLGLDVTEGGYGMLDLHLPSGAHVLVYPKDVHVPAEFTILNFPVHGVEAAVDELVSRGVEMIRYPGTDDKGIWRGGGPVIAWFTDPAGNIISVVEDDVPAGAGDPVEDGDLAEESDTAV